MKMLNNQIISSIKYYLQYKREYIRYTSPLKDIQFQSILLHRYLQHYKRLQYDFNMTLKNNKDKDKDNSKDNNSNSNISNNNSNNTSNNKDNSNNNKDNKKSDFFFNFKHNNNNININENRFYEIISKASITSQGLLPPLDSLGDTEVTQKIGSNNVNIPARYKVAFNKFASEKWLSFLAPTEYGGQGLPFSLSIIINEMFSAGSLTLSAYTTLSEAAIYTLSKHGSDEIKSHYIPHLACGNYTSTICVTESQCGSDLSLIETTAQEIRKDVYQINGVKTFVSCGEHDLSKNIIHLVLAKVKQSDETTTLSLFLVPKRKINSPKTTEPEKSLNGVRLVNVENKLGLQGVPLCELRFENSEGYLIGGFNALETYISFSKFRSALTGVAIAEKSFQASLRYSKQRRANKAIRRSPLIKIPADPIIVHADIRKMLLIQKAFVEGGRSLIYEHAKLRDKLEIAQREQRLKDTARYNREVQFMTPILKGFLTEIANEAASYGIQIHGGKGILKEFGVEQLYRDARLYTIYNGPTTLQGYELLTNQSNAESYSNTLSISEYCSELLSHYESLLKLNIYSSYYTISPVVPYADNHTPRVFNTTPYVQLKQYYNQQHGKGKIGESLNSISGIPTEIPTKPNPQAGTSIPLIITHIAILHDKVKEWIDITERLNLRYKLYPHTLNIGSNDYIMYCGYIILCDHWLKMEDASFRLLIELENNKDQIDKKDYEEQKQFYESKIQMSQFVFEYILPRVQYYKESMFTSSASIMGLPVPNFSFDY